MRIVADSTNGLREYNHCHDPETGEFCSGAGSVVRDEPVTYAAKGGITGFYNDLDEIAQHHPMLDREVILQGSVIVDLQNRGDYLYLTGLRSAAQGTGAGTKAMQSIVDLADKHGVTIRLIASPLPLVKGGPIKKTPKAKLLAFYQRFGFVKDPNYHGKDYLVRHPH